MKKTIATLLTFTALTSLALAQTTVTTKPPRKGNASTTAATMSQAKMDAQKTKATAEIDKRIDALNKLQDRIKEMKNVTSAQQSSLVSTVQSEIGNLTILKSQIAAETDAANLKTEIESITKGQRVYALVMPQISILAAADRATTIISMLTTVGSKLQARIAADASLASNTTVTKSMADFSAKLADAQTQIQAATTEVTGLTPDNGDTAKFQANQTALKDARKKLQAAHADLVAVRKDATAVVKVLGSTAKKDMKATMNGNSSSGAASSTHP